MLIDKGSVVRMILLWGLSLLGVGVVAHAGEVQLQDWDFRHGDVSLDEWQSLWGLETNAAEADGALTISPRPGSDNGVSNAFILADVYDSSVSHDNDEAGTPVISCEFDAIASGRLLFSAGTSGTQNQNAMITLLAKGRPLLLIKLTNNHTGTVVSGSGKSEYNDPVSWFNRARDYAVVWSGNGTATITLKRDSGELIEIGPVKFLAPGKPDEIKLQVGYGRAVGKALRVEQFSLYSNNEN